MADQTTGKPEPRSAEDAVRDAWLHANYYSAYPSAAVGAFLGALKEQGFEVRAIEDQIIEDVTP